jgi:hypothetical protein
MTHDLILIVFSALAGYSARGLIDRMRASRSDRRSA